jgi:hypothetical protein
VWAPNAAWSGPCGSRRAREISLSMLTRTTTDVLPPQRPRTEVRGLSQTGRRDSAERRALEAHTQFCFHEEPDLSTAAGLPAVTAGPGPCTPGAEVAGPWPQGRHCGSVGWALLRAPRSALRGASSVSARRACPANKAAAGGRTRSDNRWWRGGASNSATGVCWGQLVGSRPSSTENNGVTRREGGYTR